MCCTLKIRQGQLTLQQKHKSKSIRLEFAKYYSNCTLSCLRRMSQLFIDDILKTFKKRNKYQLWVLILMTSTPSANLVPWSGIAKLMLTVSGNDRIGRVHQIWRTDACSMRYRFISLVITHTANPGLQGAMHGPGLEIIIVCEISWRNMEIMILI